MANNWTTLEGWTAQLVCQSVFSGTNPAGRCVAHRSYRFVHPASYAKRSILAWFLLYFREIGVVASRTNNETINN